jgi:hypothetical protein
VDADKYEVLSFDCYGTLVDWEGGIVSGLRPVLRAHGVEASDEEILDLHAGTEHRLQSRRSAPVFGSSPTAEGMVYERETSRT